MWKIIAASVLATACLQAQAFRELLLPQPRHIIGVVVDPEGTPVGEARIDHSEDHRKAYRTDSDGRFNLDTRAPVLVIRKFGFRSELIRTKDTTEIRVQLQRFASLRSFPSCPNTGQFDGIEAWDSSLRFPRMPPIKATRQTKDIDYGARWYYVETPSGKKGIMHGSGRLWTLGTPVDPDVWKSVDYHETIYEFHGISILDARGEFANGHRWRYLGMFGESASYSDVDPSTANILDKFLDGACAKWTPPRRVAQR